ncbi:MAG: hypothetical protein KDD76_05175, partial [Rickettsiales bacterium]|nr:hypothetical protein [Rickettsiales bacterium]
MAQLLLDLLMIALLGTTVGYCVTLSRKVAQLRKGRQEMAEFIGEFNTAIVRAEDNITRLKELSQMTDATLKEHISRAEYLANDLSFLADRGETIAKSLDQSINQSRGLRPTQPATQPQKATPPRSIVKSAAANALARFTLTETTDAPRRQPSL